MSFNVFLSNKRCHIISISIHAESCINPQLLCQLMTYTWTSANNNHLISKMFRLHKLNKFRHIFNMNILLRNCLRDKNCICIHLDSPCKKLLIGNLTTKIVSLYHIIALQAIMSCITLHIHDSINTNSMSICPGTCSHNNKFPSNIFLDKLICCRHIHYITFNFRYMNGSIIYSMSSTSIAIKKGISGSEFMIENNLWVFHTHSPNKLLCCLHGLCSTRNRQCKTQLHLTVIHSITVRFYLFES